MRQGESRRARSNHEDISLAVRGSQRKREDSRAVCVSCVSYYLFSCMQARLAPADDLGSVGIKLYLSSERRIRIKSVDDGM